MKEEELREEIEEELPSFWKSFLKLVIALFLILIMILWIVPHESFIDPQPSYVPTIEEVFTEKVVVNTSHKVNNRLEFPNFIDAKDPLIKQTANSIVSMGCDGSKVCNAKSLYYFVQRNINYVSDPNFEYGQFPAETLSSRGGDCDDMAILLAALMESVGINTRLVFIPNHVYIEIFLPDARAYADDIGWVPLDPTCDACKFGKLPYGDVGKETFYVEV